MPATDFAHAFDGVAWDVEPPERLRELLTDPAWQFGRCHERWTHVVVRVRAAT